MSLANYYKKLFFVTASIFFLSFSYSAHAGLGLLGENKTSINEETDSFKGSSGMSAGGGLQQIVATLIQVFIGLLGVIFVILIIAAGYQWFMAGGDAAKVTQAKDKITRAVIGLTIIISAYAITYFVFQQLNTINTVNTTSGSQLQNGH